MERQLCALYATAMSTSRGHVSTCSGHVSTRRGHMGTRRGHMGSHRGHVSTHRGHVTIPRGPRACGLVSEGFYISPLSLNCDYTCILIVTVFFFVSPPLGLPPSLVSYMPVVSLAVHPRPCAGEPSRMEAWGTDTPPILED